MKSLFLILLTVFIIQCSSNRPVQPYGPLPAERQIKWHELGYYMFIHFSINTFTDKEWGYGDESPSLFNPSELDCRQWAKVARDAGMKGIVITAKHHDGFCLWPSQYTGHSVKNSPWRNGNGDLLRELRQACDEYGLKLGIYLSPWDRNSSVYGTPEYLTYYRNQLRELLTNYGDIFEVWFDGANGGTGYYGGAKETRRIDNRTYYDWPNTINIVRELQPQAVIFSDAGPDIRWVGNERGIGSLTNWCLLKKDEMYPGGPFAEILGEGHEDGNYWVPAEADVSIRPGWFWHAREDSLVKSPQKLMDIFYTSIGRNCNLILNVPPDKRGLIHENDVKSLLEFKKLLDLEFSNEMAKGKKVTASDTRGRNFAASRINDGDPETYWAAHDNVTNAELIIDLGRETEVNRILIQEYIPLGQRIKKFSVLAWTGNEWSKVTEGTTVGYKIIRKFPVIRTSKIQLRIEESKTCPVISNIELYRAPGE